jgi:hypothetical protein
MFEAILLTIVIAPPLLVSALQKTRLWWTPGVALAIGGMIPFTQLDTTAHAEDAALAGLANGALFIAGMCLLGYGALMFAISVAVQRSLRKRAATPPPPAPELPEAKVVGPSKT